MVQVVTELEGSGFVDKAGDTFHYTSSCVHVMGIHIFIDIFRLLTVVESFIFDVFFVANSIFTCLLVKLAFH